MEKCRYEIMHGQQTVALIDLQGHCEVYEKAFMPYALYLEPDAEDIDTLVNNVTNFYYWCANRILTLDRTYAKEILNSIGAAQAVTDRERAQIALSYRCLSLTDIYWVRKQGDTVSYDEVNLYENHLSNAFVDVSLRGKQMTVENQGLIRDLSTNGCFPKAWLRRRDGFYLLKGGGAETVEREVLASRICQCFRCRQVVYQEEMFEGEKVSVSRLMTSRQQSIVSREAFEIYAANRELDPEKYILQLDGESFYRMNILDYLIGNTDRHWGNWGFLVDNRTNQPLYLHPLMDFNQAFHAYDTVEGAGCQTVRTLRMTQKEAALVAVKQVGLGQIKEIEEGWFSGKKQEYEMFQKRLGILRECE